MALAAGAHDGHTSRMNEQFLKADIQDVGRCSWTECDAMAPATSFDMRVMQVGHPRSVDLIQALIDAAASDEELNFVGAGWGWREGSCRRPTCSGSDRGGLCHVASSQAVRVQFTSP